MSNHPSRFDPAKKYKKVLFSGEERHAHAHDFNDAQDILAHRIKKVAGALIADGDVLSGGVAVADGSGLIRLEASEVYAAGQVHEVAARDIQVPLDRSLAIGICLVEEVVDYRTDPDLKGQVSGTRAYGEPGQDRLRVEARWISELEACDNGRFYPVYQVVDGQVLDQSPPPQLDPVNEALARYDREANGHYIVFGWEVIALGPSTDVDGRVRQVFSVSEGTINVWGHKLTRTTASRLAIEETPDIRRVTAEPHIVPADAAGAVTIALNHGPVMAVNDVTVIREKTASITHGPYAGAIDPLPDISVAEIVSVSQGGTRYVQGQDFVLNADRIDWSATGGNEPAPGSTYEVVYRHVSEEAPEASDSASVTVRDPVPGSTVLVDYDWALPRVDAITVTREGEIVYIQGQAREYDPWPPKAPLDSLMIATVTNRWRETPEVDNVGTRSVHYNELNLHRDWLRDLYDLVAQERLKRDMDARQPTAKRGVFVDPLLDDDMRDQGLAQTAAIVDETLRLPVAVTSQTRILRPEPVTLPFVERLVLEQALATSAMRINPYQAFEPLPARVHLDPAMDMWTEMRTAWSSTATRRIVRGSGNRSRLVGQRWDVESLGVSAQALEFLRQRDVLFEIEGFGAGERLAAVIFDGVAVTPREIAAPLVADDQGRLSGVFTIPPDIPAGAKAVRFEGAGGTVGEATYIGQGRLQIENFRQVRTLTFQRWRADPLAQTFTLAQDRQISGLDIRFETIGDRTKPVVVQIRATDLGLPSRTVLAAAWLDMQGTVTGAWTHIAFEAPVPLSAGTEYAIVLLTDDADHAVATAGVGDFDTDRQQFVGAQPYQVGVLLSSSNASTWTPHQTHDLTFRLYGAAFTETRAEIALPESVQLDGCTDLLIDCGTEEPGTATRVGIEVVRASGEVYRTAPGQPIRFAEPVTEQVSLRFVPEGSEQAAPVIFPWVQITQGRLGESGDYISRAMPAGPGPVNVIVTLEALIPSGAALEVAAGAPDNWQAMTLHSATPLGDGWVEHNYLLEGYEAADVRVRVGLTGQAAARPQVRQIRANVTADPVNIITGQ